MIGIIFATRREAAPFLGDTICSRGEPLRVAIGNGRDAVVVISGMGPDAAAAACRLLVAQHRLNAIVNAGICGAVSDGAGVGTILWVSEARHEPEPGQESATVHYRCQEWPWSTRLAEERLTTCAAPVFEPKRRQAIATWGGIVDMEGAAIAAVCSEHQLPCFLIKAVSDLADAQGKESVKQHIDSLSVQIAELLHSGLVELDERQATASAGAA